MESEFEGGFEANDACVEILDAELLPGNSGAEVVDFISESNGSRKSIPDSFSESHR